MIRVTDGEGSELGGGEQAARKRMATATKSGQGGQWGVR